LRQQPVLTGTHTPGASGHAQSALQGQTLTPEQSISGSHISSLQQPSLEVSLQMVSMQTLEAPGHSGSFWQHIGEGQLAAFTDQVDVQVAVMTEPVVSQLPYEHWEGPQLSHASPSMGGSSGQPGIGHDGQRCCSQRPCVH